MERFFKLHEALGLDAEAALEDHCRAWVELTTSRALGESRPVAQLEAVNEPHDGSVAQEAAEP